MATFKEAEQTCIANKVLQISVNKLVSASLRNSQFITTKLDVIRCIPKEDKKDEDILTVLYILYCTCPVRSNKLCVVLFRGRLDVVSMRKSLNKKAANSLLLLL